MTLIIDSEMKELVLFELNLVNLLKSKYKVLLFLFAQLLQKQWKNGKQRERRGLQEVIKKKRRRK